VNPNKRDPLEEVLRGFTREQEHIRMTDEMARRVNVDQGVARRYLATAKTEARITGALVNMAWVARAIKARSEENK